jgi:rhodanese-related sulfurtransferase
MNTSIKLVLFVLVVSLISLSCKNNNSSNNKKAINSPTTQRTLLKNQQITSKITVLTPAEFKEKSQNNSIIDVRTPSEFSSGHIKEAVNINIFDKDFISKMDAFDKNKPVYVYCRSGHRSGNAAKKMRELGFKEIYDLQGGIINWVRSNNEIEK